MHELTSPHISGPSEFAGDGSHYESIAESLIAMVMQRAPENRVPGFQNTFDGLDEIACLWRLMETRRQTEVKHIFTFDDLTIYAARYQNNRQGFEDCRQWVFLALNEQKEVVGFARQFLRKSNYADSSWVSGCRIGIEPNAKGKGYGSKLLSTQLVCLKSDAAELHCSITWNDYNGNLEKLKEVRTSGADSETLEEEQRRWQSLFGKKGILDFNGQLVVSHDGMRISTTISANPENILLQGQYHLARVGFHEDREQKIPYEVVAVSPLETAALSSYEEFLATTLQTNATAHVQRLLYSVM